MYRMIKDEDRDRTKVIEITMIVDDEGAIAAASSYLHHPKSIEPEKRITDGHLQLLNDIILSFDMMIKSYKFDIVKKYSASNSYSYYIHFDPITESGEKLSPVRLIFRVSNHPSRSAKGSINSPKVRAVTFMLGEENFQNSLDLIEQGSQILERLYHGDKSVLDELPNL